MAIKIHKLEKISHDERGDILGLVRLNDAKIRSVLKITMEPGSPPRGNHWHKADTHWVYCDKGKMRYSEANPKTPKKVESVILKPGQLVVSKPGRIHAMEVVGKEMVIFYAISTEARDQEHYEEDTIRVKIV
jgi:oxalate decarboxylase/phosphoglucose isomerase-like protein (cupin superfamily)